MTGLNSVLFLIGSNENGIATIEKVASELKMLFSDECCMSDVLVSKAVHSNGVISGKPDYQNALCWAKTSLTLERLIIRLKQLEEAFGRKRGNEANGLVALDLDVVFWNGQNIRESDSRQHYFLNCLNNLRSKYPDVKWSQHIRELCQG